LRAQPALTFQHAASNWGNLRNELEWGIVSCGDNGSGANSTADNFIDYALNTRWAVGFLPTTQPGGIAAGGGVVGHVERELLAGSRSGALGNTQIGD
jgi:hypothetical protein